MKEQIPRNPAADLYDRALEVSVGVGVDIREVLEFAAKNICTRTYGAFYESLYELDKSAEVRRLSKSKRMAVAALSYSPLLVSDGLSDKFLIASAFSDYASTQHFDDIGIQIFTEGPDRWFRAAQNITPLVESARTKICDYVGQTLMIDGKKSLGQLETELHRLKDSGFRSINEAFFYDLQTLASIVDAQGVYGPRRLRENFGIEHFIRYPLEALITQADPGFEVSSDSVVQEIPIITGQRDVVGSLAYDTTPEHLYEVFNREDTLSPVFYECSGPEQFEDILASAVNPAFGFINTHSDSEGMGLGAFIDYPTTRITPNLVQEQIRRTWKNAGGVALLGCLTADRNIHGDPNPLQQMRELFWTPVAGTDFEVSTVSLMLNRTDEKCEVRVDYQGEGDQAGGMMLGRRSHRCHQAHVLTVAHRRNVLFDKTDAA